MMTSQLSQLSDAQLLEMAYGVGREIDRRWTDTLLMTFKESKDVFVYFHYRLWTKRQEHLYVLLMDNKSRLIEERLISLGTIDASLIHAREVFAPALEKRASAIILVHNHPSGLALPSPADLTITRRLKRAAKMLNIGFLDHLIIGKNQYYSDVQKRVIFI